MAKNMWLPVAGKIWTLCPQPHTTEALLTGEVSHQEPEMICSDQKCSSQKKRGGELPDISRPPVLDLSCASQAAWPASIGRTFAGFGVQLLPRSQRKLTTHCPFFTFSRPMKRTSSSEGWCRQRSLYLGGHLRPTN